MMKISLNLEHNYKLESLTEDEKQSILKEKHIPLDISDYSKEEKIQLNTTYPGFLFSDHHFFDTYLASIFGKYHLDTQVFTQPRGYIGQDTCLIIGIAPGYSIHSFGESTMLLGPSSKFLHTNFSFDYRFYFTNISKNPLKNNSYNKSDISEKQIKIISDEINFFKDRPIIFLGKYDIYTDLISSLKLKQYVIVKHPSYYLRKHTTKFDELALIKKLLK